MNHKIFKSAFALVVAAVIVITASGCRQGNLNAASATQEALAPDTAPAADSSPDTRPGGIVSVTYRIGGDNDIYGAWFQKVIAGYKQVNPNVTVNLTPITSDENIYYTKVDLDMGASSNSSLDIVMEDSFLISSEEAAGYLLTLDDKVAGWPDWNQFVMSIKQAVTGEDGHIYGIPYNTDIRGLWYQKDVFRQAGLPDDWRPKDWNDILDACKAIKDKCPGITPFSSNFGKGQGEAASMQLYEMLLFGTGERLVDDDDKWIVSSPGILASLNFLRDIFINGYGPDLSAAAMTRPGTAYGGGSFPNALLGISLNDSNWIAGNRAERSIKPWPVYADKFGFAAMPTNKGQDPGTITLAGGWCWSIAKNSKNPEAAWDFLKFMCNKENMMALDMALGNLSARSDIARDPAFSITPFVSQASTFMETVQFRPANTLNSTLSAAVHDMVESVAIGTDPKVAMSKYGADVTAIVGEDNTVTIPLS